jgi:hypothetical protein
MRILLRLGNENKRAVSNVVAYVLLIVIAVALSVLVYNWLRFYVGEGDVSECLDGVGIIIKDYNCYETNEFGAGRLSITLKNKGRFSIDGFSLRVHDRPGAEFGFYTLDEVGASIIPGGEHSVNYSFDDYIFDDDKVLETLTLVEVQPFMMEGGNISCRSYAYQELVCAP